MKEVRWDYDLPVNPKVRVVRPDPNGDITHPDHPGERFSEIPFATEVTAEEVIDYEPIEVLGSLEWKPLPESYNLKMYGCPILFVPKHPYRFVNIDPTSTSPRIPGVKSSIQEFPYKDIEPINNDGRSTCYWCGSNTVKRQGFTSVYDICETCEK